MRKPENISAAATALIMLIIQCLLMAFPCISEAADDLTAINTVLTTFERGYEGRDVEQYMSVFSSKEYEYVSDMTTPDDPSDDIRLTGIKSERRAAVRVFNNYENIDLEITDPEITINGSTAQVKNEIKIVFVVFKKPNVPESYYAASSNLFFLKKFNGDWKIIRWQQHEVSAEELIARDQETGKSMRMDSLIQNLGDSHLGTWTSAIVALRKKGVTAIKPLIQALKNSDRSIRIRAATVLYGTQDSDALQALMETLANRDDDLDVRVAVVNALSGCDGEVVDDALFAAIVGSEPELKSALSLALARRLRGKMDRVYRIAMMDLQHEDEAVRKAAAESLGTMAFVSIQGADALEQRFKDQNESESVRLAALLSLRQLRSESIFRLFRETLKNKAETEQIRLHAARSLARDKQSVELLIDVAKDKKENFEIRRESIVALGSMGDSKAVKPLIDVLNSSDADIRREAARALEQLGDRRALKPLIMMLMNRDENIYARRLAGGGIIRIDRDLAFGPLVQIMKDETENAPARRMAAERLVSFTDGRSVPSFIEIMKNEQTPFWLSRIAANYLASFSDTERFYRSEPYMEALEAARTNVDQKTAEIAQGALEKIQINLGINLLSTYSQTDQSKN